jgi:hypothetical protein
MPWTTKPTRSDNHTLSAPHAGGIYIPGTLVTLQLEVGAHLHTPSHRDHEPHYEPYHFAHLDPNQQPNAVMHN